MVPKRLGAKMYQRHSLGAKRSWHQNGTDPGLSQGDLKMRVFDENKTFDKLKKVYKIRSVS